MHDKLMCPIVALMYEHTVQRLMLIEVLKLHGIYVRLSPASDDFNVNYTYNGFEHSTVVRTDDSVRYLYRLLKSIIHKEKNHGKEITKPRTNKPRV